MGYRKYEATIKKLCKKSEENFREIRGRFWKIVKKIRGKFWRFIDTRNMWKTFKDKTLGDTWGKFVKKLSGKSESKCPQNLLYIWQKYEENLGTFSRKPFKNVEKL